jgi:hypothetical protein
MSIQSKGFSNALLLMLSEDTSCSTPQEKFSIECTPDTTPRTDKISTATNLLSRDLIRKLEDCSPVKPFMYEDDEEVKRYILSVEMNYCRQYQPSIINLMQSPPDDCAARVRPKDGWYCPFCNNYNYIGKEYFNSLVRVRCNRCSKQPQVNNVARQLDFGVKKKPFQERAGDWVCLKCKNLNFSFRVVCNRCQSAKSEKDKVINIL